MTDTQSARRERTCGGLGAFFLGSFSVAVASPTQAPCLQDCWFEAGPRGHLPLPAFDEPIVQPLLPPPVPPAFVVRGDFFSA